MLAVNPQSPSITALKECYFITIIPVGATHHLMLNIDSEQCCEGLRLLNDQLLCRGESGSYIMIRNHRESNRV